GELGNARGDPARVVRSSNPAGGGGTGRSGRSLRRQGGSWTANGAAAFSGQWSAKAFRSATSVRVHLVPVKPAGDLPHRAGPDGTPAPGPVLIIGGAEDKLKNKTILHRFVQLAGGPKSCIVVVSTASSLGEQATELYRMLFAEMGAAEIVGLRPLTRREANEP